MCIYLFIYVVSIDHFQFIILASAALCCTAFAYPVFEEYQYAGHDLSSHDTDNFDSGSYQPVASSRIGVHELGGHDDEHVDYYVCRHICNEHHIYLFIYYIERDFGSFYLVFCLFARENLNFQKPKFTHDFFSSLQPEIGTLKYTRNEKATICISIAV